MPFIPRPSTAPAGEAGFTDAFSLKLQYDETANVVPTDAATFALALAAADTNADLAEAVSLGISGAGFADSTVAPTDSQVFTLRIWLSGSTGGTNPGNADGQNDGTIATLQTAVAGATTVTMTTFLGPNVPTAIITSAIYRGWFKSVNTVTTSQGTIRVSNESPPFEQALMFSNAALNTTVDHLNGSFTFDLIAAGFNTLAKIQSIRINHATADAVAGVTPHVLTVDAGCIELAGAF